MWNPRPNRPKPRSANQWAGQSTRLWASWPWVFWWCLDLFDVSLLPKVREVSMFPLIYDPSGGS